VVSLEFGDLGFGFSGLVLLVAFPSYMPRYYLSVMSLPILPKCTVNTDSTKECYYYLLHCITRTDFGFAS